MSLIKDGKVYRTVEEQLLHLTEEHLQQISFNENISKKLQDLTVVSNIGGHNIVRNAFSSTRSYKLSAYGNLDESYLSVSKGDFIIFRSSSPNDIPAYGFAKSSGGIKTKSLQNNIDFVFYGDFEKNLNALVIENVTQKTNSNILVSMSECEATNLSKLNANDYKKQVFTVIHDENYGCKTKYVSYDINEDGVYNFVYIGATEEGKDGTKIYTISSAEDFELARAVMKPDDLLFYTNNVVVALGGGNEGDVKIFKGNYEYSLVGNIKGKQGIRGEQGEKGEQGIQGIQGVQGIQGIQGIQGENGKNGCSLNIRSGILNNISELPSFSSANVNDAYRVINTSGSVITYDLYFKAIDGTDWDIQPNWGGIQGEKGERGERGLQGVQGIQGIQGERGYSGLTGIVLIPNLIDLASNYRNIEDYMNKNLTSLLKANGVVIPKAQDANYKSTHMVTLEFSSIASSRIGFTLPLVSGTYYAKYAKVNISFHYNKIQKKVFVKYNGITMPTIDSSYIISIVAPIDNEYFADGNIIKFLDSADLTIDPSRSMIIHITPVTEI